MSKLLHLLTALVLVAGCTPALPTPEPLPTPQMLRVSLDPALAWLEPALSACAASQPDLAILRADGDPSADLWLSLGAPTGERAFSAAIGYDELVIAVHPDNPIDTLSAASVARLFTTETLTWQDILSDTDNMAVGFSEPVEPLVYSSDSALYFSFLSTFSGIDRPAADLLMLPSPAAMRAEIAARPGAIGVLPSHWLDDTVKPAALTGLADPSTLRLPVIAAASEEPQNLARAWLLCVQDILQPTNLT